MARESPFVTGIIGLAVVVATIAACVSATTPPSVGPVPEDFRISLERGACFGTCPVYTLTVLGNGSVRYEGLRFVEVEGEQTALLEPEAVDSLLEAIVDADFFDLKDEYTVPATDLPSITIGVTLNGRTKQVYHYGVGCGADPDTAPPGLCALEAQLEGIPMANGWVSAGP